MTDLKKYRFLSPEQLEALKTSGAAVNAPLERKSDGKLWAFTSVGSYPIVYVTQDGGDLCPGCANGENGSEASETTDDPQWKLIGAQVHWEGEPLECSHCNADIESAYGVPE